MMPVVTNLWKVKMESCTVSRSETARRFSPNLGTIRAKATRKVEAKVEPTEFFRSARIGHIRADCRAKTHINGGHPKFAQKGKRVGSCEEEDPSTSQNVPWWTSDLGSFEVLSDHGDTVEDADVDESLEEATGIMPPLPLVSWFKNAGT